MKTSILILTTAFLLCSADSFAGWIKRADFGSHGRHRGTSLSIGNRGYMGLGHYNGAGPNVVMKDWWEYDPATNAWTQKADYIGNNGNGNYAPLAFSIGDYGYLAGGTLGDAMLYKYDPTLNQWSSVVTCPTTPGNTAGFSVNGKAYYVSGNTLYEFDPSNNTWLTKNAAPYSSTSWNSAFTIGDKSYVKNGFSFWEYKSTTDSWTGRASFPGLAQAASMAFSKDGKGYIVCGYGTGWLSDVNSEVWEYDPLMNSWTQLEDFPGTSRRFGCAFSIGNRAYVGIGTNGTNFNDFWEFDRNLSLDEPFDANQFTTYPNPASDFIIFKSDQLNTFTITVYDASGKEIYSEETTNGKLRLDNNNYQQGTYFYNVSLDGVVLYNNQFIFN